MFISFFSLFQIHSSRKITIRKYENSVLTKSFESTRLSRISSDFIHFYFLLFHQLLSDFMHQKQSYGQKLVSSYYSYSQTPFVSFQTNQTETSSSSHQKTFYFSFLILIKKEKKVCWSSKGPQSSDVTHLSK